MSTATSHVLVLIAPPGALDEAALARAREGAGRGALGASRWLAPGEAFEAEIVSDAGAMRTRVAAALTGLPVDVNVVAGRLGRRMKRLLIADMDSTIIRQECIDEMADLKGIKPEVAAVTERAMRGELDFEAALKARLALLEGIAEGELEQLWRERIELMPGAKVLISTMRAAGALTALVSGGFTFFTERVAAAVGFEVNHANVLEMAGGRLTGRVFEPILGREAKLATLERYRVARGLAPSETLAVGDGANDLDMLAAAGLGIAFNAKPVVADAADAAVSVPYLDAILFLLGVRESEVPSLSSLDD